MEINFEEKMNLVTKKFKVMEKKLKDSIIKI